jgi:hypothetical protein
MGIDTSGAARSGTPPQPLSGRARAALQQYQRRVALLQRDVNSVDRLLAGALTACDGTSQHEMLGVYLEAVQELRVGLQRLEGFLVQRLIAPDDGAEPRSSGEPQFDGVLARAAGTD